MEEWQQCRSSLCIYRSALPQKTVLPRAKVGRPEDLTERTGNSRLGPREGYKKGKVNQRSTPEEAEVKTESYPPPPLRSSPLSQGDKVNGKRKTARAGSTNQRSTISQVKSEN